MFSGGKPYRNFRHFCPTKNFVHFQNFKPFSKLEISTKKTQFANFFRDSPCLYNKNNNNKNNILLFYFLFFFWFHHLPNLILLYHDFDCFFVLNFCFIVVVSFKVPMVKLSKLIFWCVKYRGLLKLNIRGISKPPAGIGEGLYCVEKTKPSTFPPYYFKKKP